MAFKDELKKQSKDVYKEVKAANSFNPLKDNIDDGYRMDEQVASDIIDFIKEIFKVKIDGRDYIKDLLWGSTYSVRLICNIYLDDRGVFPDLEIHGMGRRSIGGMESDGSITLTFHSVKDLERMIPIIISRASSEFSKVCYLGVTVNHKNEWANLVPIFVRNIKKNLFNQWTSGSLPSNERSHSYVVAHFCSQMYCNRKGIIN